MITITRPTLNDLENILELWKGQYDFHHKLDNIYYVPFDNTTIPSFKKYLKKAIKKNTPRILIAKDDNGTLVGFITYDVSTSDYFDTNIKKYGEIIELFVDPRFRRQKIGTKLMQSVEGEFKKEGVNILKLQVSTFNQTAIALYQTLNYINRQTFMFKKISE
jgi:ribosomal protein S18 acetylase RimI-like enzyme